MPTASNTPDPGVFLISIDFELMWGTLDKPSWQSYLPLCQEERQFVISELLDLFQSYGVTATWCTVGHLFLPSCHGHLPHPRSCAADRVRLRRDPVSDLRADPAYYAPDLIRKIAECHVPQEIACHTFSHVLFGDPDCTVENATWELDACIDAAAALGINLTAIAFPRNRVGHTDLLRSRGFTCFRGQDKVWHQAAGSNPRRGAQRLGHLLDVLTAATPESADPILHPDGLWELPGSMLYTPSHGLRRLIPVALRVLRARRGLKMAADQGGVFHLWFHPTDLVVRRKAMLDGLRRVLDTAASYRERGQIEILGMSAFAGKLDDARRVRARAVEFQEVI